MNDMKNLRYLMLSMAVFLLLPSCADEISDLKQEGEPVLQIEEQFIDVHFGDQITFTATVSDHISLSTLTAILYFGNEEVERTTIRTKDNGTYRGTISVPFLKDIPDGTATLEFVLLNTTLKRAVKSFDVPITRASYPYLILVTKDAAYPMLPTGQPDEYAATEPFSSTDLPAYIKTPVVDDKGREITFGWETGTVTQDVTDPIPFVSPTGGIFSVTFNTKTYEASPFFEILLNGEKMTMIDKENYQIDADLTQGEELAIEGLDEIGNWWIDPDYFTETEPGKYLFVPITGKYRVTANLAHTYFRVEVLEGNTPAMLKADGSGAVWIIGDQVGKPSYKTLHVGWEPSRALCMAPIGNKSYQVTLVGGETINIDEINFKFFHQKNWGGEFGSATLTTPSDLIFIGNGANGRDNGNLGIIAGKKLETGATYQFILDLSAGINQGVLRVAKK